MDLLGIQEASLPTTPSGYYLGFSKSKKNKKDIIFGLPALDYSIKTNGKKINGSLFRFNSDYIDIAISEKSKQLKFFLKKYFSHFLEHFYIGNIYFSSEYSINQLKARRPPDRRMTKGARNFCRSELAGISILALEAITNPADSLDQVSRFT